MNQEIFKKVREIVKDQLDVDEEKVVPEANFASDLNADSLDTVELVMALEEEFDIEIPDEAAEQITTVGAAVEHISEKLETPA
ncbi:MAG: acyl carrier protein [Symploca sp. SIO3E6]|nr:acyl carrier protein [Caldora sp. SIO3E6]